jgi:WD40 repeat protein/serine/threonine protein kinase
MSFFSSLRNLFRKSGERGKVEAAGEDREVTPFIQSDTPPLDAEPSSLDALHFSKLGTDFGSSVPHERIKVWKQGDVILNTYRVLDVRMGGMGYVYIAEHLGWKVKMAIKCPNEAVLSNKSHFSRVLREADAWIGLGLHPNIAFCYYIRQIEGVPNIFIEYVDGGSLRDWIADGRSRDLRVGLDLAMQFCHGMNYAHKRGMIHRDVKPENILLTSGGLVKITDFGIAMVDTSLVDSMYDAELPLSQVWDRDALLTSVGSIMGSPSYMAPEQWEDSHSVDFRADVFSFGVCMYEMFCGERPFRRSSRDARERGIPPFDPIELRRDLPPRLAEVLRRCVSFDRDGRFDSFADLGTELAQIYRDLFGEDPPHSEVSEVVFKADGLNNRAVSYLELGRKQEAAALWERALREDPQHLESTFNYGYLKWQSLEISDEVFVAHMRELESAWGSNPDYWRCMGWISLERGDFEAVEKIQRTKYRISDSGFAEAQSEWRKNMLTPVKSIRGSRWGVEDFTALALSPDGKYAVTGSSDGVVRMWDISLGEMLREMGGHVGGVRAVDISPDGSFAASGGEDGTTVVWEMASRKPIAELNDGRGGVYAVRFSPGGDVLAVGGADSIVRIWDFRFPRVIKSLVGHTDAVLSLAFSSDGRLLASSGKDSNIRLWSVETGRLLYAYIGHNDSVMDLGFSPSGRFLISASADNTLRLWDVMGGKEIKQFRFHNDLVCTVSFSPEGDYVLSGGWDKVVRISSVASGYGSWQQRHLGRVVGARFALDGRRVVSVDREGTILLWEVSYPKKVAEYVHPYPLLCKVSTVDKISLLRKEAKAVVASASQAIKGGDYQGAYGLLRRGLSLPGYERDRELIDLVTLCASWGKGRRRGLNNAWLLTTLKGHTDWVSTVSISPSCRFVLSAGYDKTVRLWDLGAGKQVRIYDEGTWGEGSGNVNSVEFSSNGHYAVSGGWDGKVRLWEVMSGSEVKRFAGHEGYVTSVRIGSDGSRIISGGVDGTVRLWDVGGYGEIARLRGHKGIVFSVQFSRDATQAVSAGDDGVVRLWDVPGGRLIGTLVGHAGGVLTVDFSPDGVHVVSGGNDGTIRLWDIKAMREVRRLDGHGSWVSSVCFSPDGKYVLSGSRDATMRLWDVSSGVELRRFEGHTAWVTCVRFSQDGRFAATGSWDHSVIVWEFDWDWEFL